MATSELSVVFFQPLYGNYLHWALHLHIDPGHVMYQVLGSHGTFEANVERANPLESRLYIRSIFLTTVNKSDIPLLEQVVQDAIVENDTVEWDCQDYVLEILDGLEEECVVDGEDDEYQRAKTRVKNKRGSTL